MFRNQSASTHQFAMVPRAEVPRSKFKRQFTHKSAFNAADLVPIYVDEVLPGDTFNFHATIFCRMATPIYPLMDNLHLDTFFFFVPNRLVWDNWQKFMGQQNNPGDSTSFAIPTHQSPNGGYAVGSLQDYMGLPTVGQVGGGNHFHHSALPLRSYNLIFQEWFRDQNLVNQVTVDKGDSGDNIANYTLLKRGKRHDYFTSCLPWTQKGTAVSIPIAGTAPVVSTGNGQPTFTTSGTSEGTFGIGAAGDGTYNKLVHNGGTNHLETGNLIWSDTKLVADLSTTTSATINQLRQSFQIQKLLERDARGGTRYTEIVQAHFGVKSPDARLQRPEYLGGGSTPVGIHPVTQTSQTGLTGGTTPLGHLSGFAAAISRNNGFSASFTEHGYIIGLASVRADLTYQQGLHKMWSRSTRYDFYFPAFAMLGEQAVLNKEIYCDGSANDDNVFGYQERWAEYRHFPSRVSGLMRSTASGTLDGWHLAQRFNTLPTLNSTFITEAPPMDRVLAVGAGANGQHFIMDAFFDNTVARLMPMYSVPGLIDHF